MRTGNRNSEVLIQDQFVSTSFVEKSTEDTHRPNNFTSIL